MSRKHTPGTRTRAEASRENGRKSRGPITPEGKAISSQNSRTHSLTSAALCLSIEDQPAFDALLADFRNDLQPANAIQSDLVAELAAIRWRQRRLWHIQTGMLDNAMDIMAPEIAKTYDSIDTPTRLARAFSHLADESNSLELLRRYDSTYTRMFDRTLANLLELQRLQNHSDQLHSASEPQPRPQPEPEQNMPDPIAAPILRNEPKAPAPVIPITPFQPLRNPPEQHD
jgi:hypothetical protein